MHQRPAAKLRHRDQGLSRPGPDQWTPQGEPDYLRAQAFKSLKKLGVERIDLWQLHRIDPRVPRNEQFAAVKSLLDEGVIAHAGLGEVSVEDITAAQILRFALGMFVGGILPTANALVGGLVASSHRGLAFGVTASATFLGSFLGPLMGGSVAAVFGIRWVFVVTGALFLANLLWVFRVVPDVNSESDADNRI